MQKVINKAQAIMAWISNPSRYIHLLNIHQTRMPVANLKYKAIMIYNIHPHQRAGYLETKKQIKAQRIKGLLKTRAAPKSPNTRKTRNNIIPTPDKNNPTIFRVAIKPPNIGLLTQKKK